jgi:hypothetical protein
VNCIKPSATNLVGATPLATFPLVKVHQTFRERLYITYFQHGAPVFKILIGIFLWINLKA